MMTDLDSLFLQKAQESLEGAQSEFVHGRYNNCANRAYYACFQAAIHALLLAGIGTPGASEQWGHDHVQASFVGQLINRRKLYVTGLRSTLEQNYRLREVADYHRRDLVTEVRAARAVSRAEAFVEAVRQQGEQST